MAYKDEAEKVDKVLMKGQLENAGEYIPDTY